MLIEERRIHPVRSVGLLLLVCIVVVFVVVVAAVVVERH